MRATAALFVCVTLVACGLSVEGTLAVEGAAAGPGNMDASVGDGGTISREGGSRVDADVSVPDAFAADVSAPDGSAPDAACNPSPSGWHRVAYVSSRSTPCPSDTVATDVVENPTPGTGTCTCPTCEVTQQQSCRGGNPVWYFDNANDPTCTSSGGTFVNSSVGVCNDDGADYDLRKHLRVTPPPATGTGACRAQVVVSKSSVTASAVRLCVPTTNDSCAAMGLADCIAAQGDQACPLEYPTKHELGTDIDVTCDSCACTVSTTCTGTITVSTHSNCSSGVAVAVPADDGCYPVSNGDNFRYSKYVGTIARETCSTATPPDATVTLTNEGTACCR